MTAPSTGASGMGPQARLVHVGRSDGRFWTLEEINAQSLGKGSPKRIGEPIPQELSQISDDKIKSLLAQWKVVVATGLAENLAWPRDSQYQVNFPEGFCLRECSPQSAGADKEVGMFGHPQGCTDEFVYRYPYEFIPHVLWLLSDSNEHNQCPCKPCHVATGRPLPRTFAERMDEQSAAMEATKLVSKAPEAKAPKKKATATRKKATTAADAVTKTATKDATAAPPAKPTKKSTVSKPPLATIPSAVVPPAPVAPADPPFLNKEPTMFRRGEMVWCQQVVGAGWRIGVIREIRPESASPYVVIGLGHSSLDIPDSERNLLQLRPFLAFSVPAISVPEIRDNDFNKVNWQGVFGNPQYSGEMVGLEASKLAALEIDGSWSTFNILKAGPKQPKNITMYGGVFLGAEMIRLGDPIRPKDKTRDTLLEITEISVTESTVQANPADPTSIATQYALAFRGIEYQAVLVDENGKIPGQPEGAIFAKDTAFRTLAAKAGGKRLKCVWQRKSYDIVWQERDVAGRSYASDELIHVTKGEEEVKKAHSTGVFQEASAFLNNRMQSAASRNYGRKANRWATYRQAVNVAHQCPRIGADITEDPED
ncbi:hypothetical protein N0V82_002286 [Gnomoniopsis sp. IMI 355080]|nr:hypothetical protein N0V82_002286 [Gnomoniopsis sp. IMI 355080]